MWYLFGTWVVLLLIEFLWFSSTLVGNYNMPDIYFIITVIFSTLIVGMTGLLLYKKN